MALKIGSYEIMRVNIMWKMPWAVILMLIEPNLGEKVLESMTVSETDKKAPPGTTEVMCGCII